MKTILTFILSLCGFMAFSSTVDTLPATTSISDVTVFFNGAQVTRSGNIFMNQGKHIISIEGLPLELNTQSIQVKQVENCQILSVKHFVKTGKNKSDNKEIMNIETQIDEKELHLKEINNQISVYELEEKLLLDNSKFGEKDKGSTIAEIKEAADFYRIRLNEIKSAKLNLHTEFENTQEDIQKLYLQANEINSKISKAYSVILIAVDCKAQSKSELKFTYYTPSAGWNPLYDFRVEDITQPLSIVYNAEVYQSTGEDWKNVNIRLSTSNPSLSGTKPELSTWFIDRAHVNYSDNKYAGSGTGSLTGTVYDSNTGETMPFVNVVIYKDQQMIGGSSTDFEGRYLIKPLQSGYYDIEANYIGYDKSITNYVNISSGNTTHQDFHLNQSSVVLSEVYVSDYKDPSIDQSTYSTSKISLGGNRYAYDYEEDGLISYDKADEKNKVKREIITTDYIANSLNNPVVNLEYIIDIPYSVPSDGQNYSMKIKEVSLPVNYIYHVVPKLDEDVFLSAEIIDRSELNLLSGKAGIYYQGTFTGESYIDVNTVSDTLNISLGRDNSIVVKREGNKEVNDKKFMGNTIKQTVGWNITVKNNKDAKVKILVYDQFPVSGRKSIEIERIEWSDAKVEDNTGKITWEAEIEPNGKKEFKYGYSVKYSKYDNILIE